MSFEYKLVFYRRHVDNIFVLFKSTDHLEKFCNYFNNLSPKYVLFIEKERNSKMSFLDVEKAINL